MNLQDLRPASEMAITSGVKSIVYGPPGSAKTPIAATAPRPVMLVCEPGMLSMKKINIPCYEAFDTKKIEDFFTWWFGSAEVKNFDTLVVDSASQLADTYLQDAQKTNKHGKAAYGEMADESMIHFRKLFFQPQKNVYLICKEGSIDNMKRPYFPGQFLNKEVPHLYDLILHLGIHNIPATLNLGIAGPTHSFQCNQSMDILARDRSGRLGMYEPADFGAIVRKVMSA